jgi:hypothetical protein
MAQMIGDAINQASANFVDALTRLLPRLVITITVVVLGWLIAMLLRGLVRLVLGWLRFGAAAERFGIAAPLKTAGLPPADVLAGSIVFWLVWIGFLVSGIDVLGFASLQGLVSAFAAFVPRLMIALVILVIGLLAANFAWRATLLAAVNAHLPSPRLVSGAVRWLILIVVGAMALEQIAVAQTIVLTAFAIAFGAVMLALAIAFGIGAGGLARRILEHAFKEPDRSGADEMSHL